MTSPVLTLYVEELKATMRGRFAWLGAAIVLLAVGGLATRNVPFVSRASNPAIACHHAARA